MHQLINYFVQAAAAELPLTDPVVEIGSFQVAGQEAMADLRPYFRGVEYIGTDMRPGPGVDRVEDVHHLSFADNSIGTILMLETLEHVANPMQALAEVRRVLRGNGTLILSTPFSWEIHNYPNDYWRLTPEAYNVLLEPIGPRLIGSIGPSKEPSTVLGVAFAGGDAAVLEPRCAALVARFKAELRNDRRIIRDRKLYKWQRSLTAWLPFQEVRRVYRRRSHLHDIRFHFHAENRTRNFDD